MNKIILFSAVFFAILSGSLSASSADEKSILPQVVVIEDDIKQYDWHPNMVLTVLISSRGWTTVHSVFLIRKGVVKRLIFRTDDDLTKLEPWDIILYPTAVKTKPKN